MKALIQKIAILMQQLGIDEDTKCHLVHQYTNGRTTSRAALTHQEARKLLTALLAQQKSRSGGDHKRKKIIGIFRQAGWETWDPQRGKMQADMPRIYQWVQRYGTQNPKHLNQYTPTELDALVTQVEKAIGWRYG